MEKVSRTNSKNDQFIHLVNLLDAELAIRDGEDHAFYHQFNGLQDIKYVVLILKNKVAVGCGALKKFSQEAVEVKRMFVHPDYRGQNLASQILWELENWAFELGFKKCILETGFNQPEAIRLYEKNKYKTTKNYGQYANVKNSVCFEKILP